jgi:hypothetical protein
VTLLQRRRQQQLRLDWTFGHAPIVCGLDPRAFPLELAPNPLGCCCCCIGGSCHSAELQNFRTSELFFFSEKQVYEKHTRSCGKFLQETNADRIQELRRKTNVGSSKWRDQLAKNAKNKQAKKQLFPIEERRRRRRRSRSEDICITHQIRIDPPAANKLLLLFFAQTLQSETLLLLLLIVYSCCY